MAQRRVSEITFNFDSLTDLVTNLAGALIMIVLLFFGLSSERVKQAATLAEMGPKRSGGSAPRSSLRVPALRVEVTEIEAKLKEQEDAVRNLRGEIAEIDRKAAREQPKEFADPGGEPGKPALVELRPPMLTTGDDLRTGAFIVVSHDRVFFLPLPDFRQKSTEIQKEFVEALNQTSDPKNLTFSADRRLTSGDFNIHFSAQHISKTVTRTKATYSFTGGTTLIKKPDAVGETEEQVLGPGSHYHALIDQLDPKKDAISFAVYAGGFELFRKIRSSILKQDRSFRYNWGPLSTGDDVPIGSEGGVQ